MWRRRPWLGLLALVALAAAGCGSASSTPKTAAVPVIATGTQSTPVTTATASPPATTATTTATTPATTTTTTSSTPTTATSPATTTPTSTSTTPLPATAAGLAAATGYGSYDSCVGTCTGSVPASLRRPLNLPALAPGGGCPESAAASIPGVGPGQGTGPVYAAQPSPLAVSSFVGSAWPGARVTFVATPNYLGPVLIRGSQIGGTGAVGFGEGHVPVDELQLYTSVTTSSGPREWPSFTRLHTPGCYAYQADGTDFSEVIVFSVTG